MMENEVLNAGVVEVPEPIEAVPAEPTQEEKMKSAYKRCGFGMAALYGVASVISSAIISAFGVIAGVLLILDPDFLEVCMGYGEPDILECLSVAMQNHAFLYAILIGVVLGSGVGYFVGGLVLKKIMPKPVEPIQKKSLSFGQFLLFVMISYGLWFVGVWVGNWPQFVYPIETNSILEMMPEDCMIIYYIYAIIGAPLVEEFIFRKVMCDSLHKYGQTVAAFVSGLTFGLLHGNSGQFIFAFMLGVVFATCYMKTGKILYTMALHAIINATSSIPAIIAAFTNDTIDGYLDTGVYVFMAVMGVIGLIVMFTSRNNDILKLEKPTCIDANKLAFSNGGMKLVCIAGTIMMISQDLLTVLVGLLDEPSPMVLTYLVPSVCSLLIVIFVNKTIGKHSQEVEKIYIEE